jgi:hypothetical protein
MVSVRRLFFDAEMLLDRGDAAKGVIAFLAKVRVLV